MPPDFASMNETDVREVVVRPFLHRLGYQHGTQATIRTEVALKYDRLFLGRKKDTDPKISDLRGRADYICEVVAVGRWVVEVKGPAQDLTPEDAYQAHTYAAHPEIAALFYLLTNGRNFALYRSSYPATPVLAWRYEETEEHLPTLRNILSPNAVTKAVTRPIDIGKPLADGLPSKLALVGGVLTYQRYHVDNPMFGNELEKLQGHRASITGREVIRTVEGQIGATLELAGPTTVWDTINRLAGLETHEFRTSDEFISTDPERPTVFQSLATAELPAGTRISVTMHMQEMTLPIAVRMTAYTNAAGSVADNCFAGIFEIDQEMELVGIPPGIPMPERVNFSVDGDFRIVFADT